MVNFDATGDSWLGWIAAAVVVVALVAASVVTCGGAAIAAGTACAIMTGTCTAVGTTATVLTGAAVGASVAFTASVVDASVHSHSAEEFASYGERALVNTVIGGVGGAINGALNAASSCFIAGTTVAAETGDIPIEQITVGDSVWAWDETTGDVSLKQVVETYINETYELTHVFVDGEEIVCTPGHPFYSPVKGWTEAVRLRAGDILQLVNGEYVVVEKVQHELLESPVKVYNFQVQDYHTYYVADSGVLVHNKCGEIDTYNRNRANNKGSGLESHHILEKRFIDETNYSSPGQMQSIAITPEQHQQYTNEWRNILPYGNKYDKQAILNAAQQVYKDAVHLYKIVKAELGLQ